MAQHHFHLQASWTGDRLGQGEISAGNLHTAISVPQELGGPGIGTNPEEMLIGAAATCYLITLAAVLANRKLEISELKLTSEGILNDERGLQFQKIIHRPVVILASGATSEQVETARKATDRAEQACMISKAIHGNVEVHVEAEVRIES